MYRTTVLPFDLLFDFCCLFVVVVVVVLLLLLFQCCYSEVLFVLGVVVLLLWLFLVFGCCCRCYLEAISTSLPTIFPTQTITIRASKKTSQEPTGPQPGQDQGQGQTDDPSSPQGQGRSGGQTEGALGQPPDLDTRTADQTGVDQGGRSPGAAATTTVTTTTTTTTHDLSEGRASVLPAPDQGPFLAAVFVPSRAYVMPVSLV